MLKICWIPGLGYDCRIFDPIQLAPSSHTYIEWLDPLPKESIYNYAVRLLEEHQAEIPDVIIGHSFGGIIAQELAAIYKIKQVFLISSVRSRKEIPFYFKWMEFFNLYPFFTKEITLKTFPYWRVRHGFDTTDLQSLFEQMVKQQSNAYLQWALKQLCIWDTPEISDQTSIIQIHGTSDRTFPIHLLQNTDEVLHQGDHLMVIKQADLVSKILRQKIKKAHHRR